MENSIERQIEIKLSGVTELLETLEVELIHYAQKIGLDDKICISVWPDSILDNIGTIQLNLMEKIDLMRKINKIKELK